MGSTGAPGDSRLKPLTSRQRSLRSLEKRSGLLKMHLRRARLAKRARMMSSSLDKAMYQNHSYSSSVVREQVNVNYFSLHHLKLLLGLVACGSSD